MSRANSQLLVERQTTSPNTNKRGRHIAAALGFFLTITTLPTTSALAAGGTSTDFRPSPSGHDGSGGLQMVHPFTGGKGSAYLGGFLNIGEEFDVPLSLRRQGSIHLGGGWAPADWLRLELDLPFVSSRIEGEAASAGIGDVQLSATIPFLSARPGGIGLGLHPFLQAPTQSATASSANPQGGALLLVGGGDGNMGWRINAGARAGDTQTGPIALGGIGGNWRFNPGFGLGAEVMVSQGLGAQADGSAPLRPIEGTVYALLGNDRRSAATVGLGTGFIPETGSPLYRASLGISWRKTGVPGDPDGDGIWGLLDDCPNTTEDMDDYLDNDGCPDPDDDRDGVPDVLDRCPSEPEDLDDYSDRDGCPDPDNDFDGVLDREDECAMDAGPVAAQGCPDLDQDGVGDKKDECASRPGSRDAFGCPDQDRDRVPDYRDLCPSQAVSSKVDPLRSNGCPSRAWLGADRIELVDRVQFDFGSTRVREDSLPLLQDVARILRENPDIQLIEIGGHTDDVGGATYNQRLSKSRAKAVEDYLISQGIDRRRLDAKGYGEARPVDTNTTEAGRTMNRRVEFLVIRVSEASRN